MTTTKKRTKSETTKLVDKVRKKIERGIRYAISIGLSPAEGVWCGGGKVCALGAVIVGKARLKNENDIALRAAFRALAPDCQQRVTAAKMLSIDVESASYIINGFDGGLCQSDSPRSQAMNSLGRRLRKKYLYPEMML